MTGSNPKIKVRRSDRLFFDRYQYCLKLYIPEMSAMRQFHRSDIELQQLTNSIEENLTMRRELDIKLSYRSSFWRHNENLSTEYREIHFQPTNLVAFAEVLYKKRDEIKLMISGSWGYVYSNDLNFLKKVSKLEYVKYCTFKEMKVDRPRGTVKLRKSPHSLRSYMTDIWVSAAEKESIVALLLNQDDIRLSPALKSWCKNGILWLQRNYFVDYNTQSFPLALQLINPKIVKKTMQIIEVNN